MNLYNEDINSIYKGMQQNFINENRRQKKKPILAKKGEAEIGENKLGKAEKGPEDADGFVAPEEADDRFNAVAKPGEMKVSEESPDQEIYTENPEKSTQRSINTNMSNGKSLFDQLYEDVMEDEDVLGIDTDEEVGEFDDFGDEGGDEVSLSLPRDVAEQLLDVLTQQLSDDDGEEDVEDEFGFEDGGEDEDENPFGEGVDFETVPEVSKDSDMGRQVVAHKDLVSSGDGDGSVTDKVGNDGDEGHALVNSKKGKGGKEDMKNQKVKTSRSSTPNAQAFGK